MNLFINTVQMKICIKKLQRKQKTHDKREKKSKTIKKIIIKN